jgi:predicted amidophosphoribosyltransferase
VRYNAVIRDWLALYKYRGHEVLAPLLGAILDTAFDRLRDELSRREASFIFDAVVPVPLSLERLQERGFNQAERMASYIADRNGLPLFDILKRTRHSDKQSFKTRGARLRDTRDLFSANDRIASPLFVHARQISLSESQPSVPRLRLLLVDDIYTTGSTVNACASAIIDAADRICAGLVPEVYVLTLARS